MLAGCVCIHKVDAALALDVPLTVVCGNSGVSSQIKEFKDPDVGTLALGFLSHREGVHRLFPSHRNKIHAEGLGGLLVALEDD